MVVGRGFDHDADQRLGAARPDEHAPLLSELDFRSQDLVAQLGGDVGMAFLHDHVDEHLRERLHHLRCHGRERLARIVQSLQQFEPGQQTVTRCRDVAVDDMPALLATDRVATRVERFQHVAVADRGGDDGDARVAHRAVKPDVAHHRDHHGVVGQGALGLQLQRTQRNQPIAVDDVAAVVDSDHAIAVAVEGQPCGRAMLDDCAGQRSGVRRAAAGVDVGAIRFGVDDDQVGAERPQSRWCGGAHRTVGTIEHDAHPAQRVRGKHADDVLDVGLDECVHDTDPSVVAQRVGPKVGVVGHDQSRLELGLDLLLDIVIQLGAAGREDLDAVVRERVVRGGDHRRRRLVRRREMSQCRRRHDAAAHHQRAGGTQAMHERCFECGTRLSGVTADEPRTRSEDPGRGGAERCHVLRCQLRERDTANTICAEAEHAQRIRLRISAWCTAGPCGPS